MTAFHYLALTPEPDRRCFILNVEIQPQAWFNID